jgi:hypothetical protein
MWCDELMIFDPGLKNLASFTTQCNGSIVLRMDFDDARAEIRGSRYGRRGL